MPKKVFAVTNIKNGEDFWDAGTEVDHTKFSKEELKALLDNGAIEIRSEEGEVEPEQTPAEASETPEAPEAPAEGSAVSKEELDSEVRPTSPDPSTIEDPAMKVENENDNA